MSPRISEMAACLKGLVALQGQITEAVREIQDVMTFGSHPGLADLDDELDILYGGQL
ncbi:hypothetical protein ACFY9G_23645 [Streptomyces anthocyanicus]|uniref:hypothetical protein n=1 Tax=Streptomyces anthocyanicus TaxID=68174 RepID=UPI0036EA50B9